VLAVLAARVQVEKVLMELILYSVPSLLQEAAVVVATAQMLVWTVVQAAAVVAVEVLIMQVVLQVQQDKEMMEVLRQMVVV
jgi:hypothetical protein